MNKSPTLRVSFFLSSFLLTACQDQGSIKINKPTYISSINSVIIINKQEPNYPRDAVLSCTEGDVILQFIIKTDGTTRNISVEKSKPEKIFDSSAINAISKWQFKPILINGKAVEKKVVQHLNYRLREPCKKRLVEKNYFDFTDGISEEEAFYIAQNVCIQAGKDKTFDIFNPSFINNEDLYSFGYSPSEKTISKMENYPSELTFNDFLPFIVYIDKQSGEVKRSVYEINNKTNKVDITLEQPAARLENTVDISDNSVAILEVIPKEIEGFFYSKTHKYPYPLGYSLRYYDNINQLIYADIYIFPIDDSLEEYNIKDKIDIMTEWSLKDIFKFKEQGKYTKFDIIHNTNLNINGRYTSKVSINLVKKNLELYSLLFVTKSNNKFIKARITMPNNEAHRKDPRWQKFVEKIFTEIFSQGH